MEISCKLHKLSRANPEVIKGKRVMVRVDYNVPIKDGRVTDDERIRQSLPTLELLLNYNAKIILVSHLGRPKGEPKKELMLNPVAECLSELLGKRVDKLDNCIGTEVESFVAGMRAGSVVLLENTRFHKEEKANDSRFSRELASLAEVFVFDAFATAHRAHASVVGVQKHIKQKYIGLLVEKELNNIARVLKAAENEKPFVVVLGGAKISDKIKVIKHMAKFADQILIGGTMPFPLMKLNGLSIGKSYYEDCDAAALAKITKLSSKIRLPSDYLIAKDQADEQAKPSNKDSIPEQAIALDIGPKTASSYATLISQAKVVIWNGPMGYFENIVFANGTKVVAEAVAKAKYSLVGGGDTIAAIHKLAPNLAKNYTYVSTGGGALLVLLSGEKLVALN